MGPGSRAIDEDVRRIVEGTYDRVRALPASETAILLRAAGVLDPRGRRGTARSCGSCSPASRPG